MYNEVTKGGFYMKYQILGESLPVVEIELDQNETIVTEGGGMSWMSNNLEMKTSAGGVGKALGRMFSGESLFLNYYTALNKPGRIAFASSMPGSIRAIEITPSKSIIVQKTGFLACETGVELSIHFRKKLAAGFFGGEGFVMQRLSGSGIAFVEIDGHAIEYDLQAGEQMIIDTGHLALMEDTVTLDIKTVGGVKNALLGGEGLFNTVVTGPGRIILQTLPVSKLFSMMPIQSR